MKPNDLVLEIRRVINDLLRQKGLEPINISPQSRLLSDDIPIDSLDLAVLVTELERLTQRDPFQSGFRDFRTVGELAQLYGE